MKNKTTSTIVGAAIGSAACAGTLLAGGRAAVVTAPVATVTRLDPITVANVPSAVPIVEPIQSIDLSQPLPASIVSTTVVINVARPAPIPTRSPARPAPIIVLPR